MRPPLTAPKGRGILGQVPNEFLTEAAKPLGSAAHLPHVPTNPLRRELRHKPWMAGNVNRSSRQQAKNQWTALHDALAKIADVLLVEPQPGSPDMVFTANAGLVLDGIVALSSFYHPERQGEEPHFRRWFQDFGFGYAMFRVSLLSKEKGMRSLKPTDPACGPVTGRARMRKASGN